MRRRRLPGAAGCHSRRSACAGAHRHSPANGLGSNTSIQDAYNLVWKLALVTRGLAGDRLLDSYHDERQPVGRQVIDRATKSTAEVGPFTEALGFRPGGSVEQAWASLGELFGDSGKGAKRREELLAALELMNWQFNAHGVELGAAVHLGRGNRRRHTVAALLA